MTDQKDQSRQVRYYWRNREAMLAKANAYRAANKELAMERTRRWREGNRAKLVAYSKQYRKDHPDVYKKCLNTAARYSVEYRKVNKEKCAEYSRNYSKNNKPKRQAICSKRRALKAGATVDPQFIVAFTKHIRSKRRVRCYYCREWTSGEKAHIDHVKALAIGGEHSVSNLCAACPSCNLSKQAKPLTQWVAAGQRFLCF